MWWRYIYIILLLHIEQIHVSELDNGHLQVVHESLSKQLYKHIYIWATYMGRGWVKWAQDLVSVRMVGTCGMRGQIRDLVPTLPPPQPLPHISSPYIYIYIYIYIYKYIYIFIIKIK